MSIIKRIFGIRPDDRTDVPNGLRGTGVSGGKGMFDEYFNQILFEIQADHIIDTEANVKLANDPRGTCYYNSGDTEFQDADDSTVTFLDGDKIAWRGLDTLTASIDISTIDDLEHVMFQGVTIPLLSFDLDLGENQRGELDISGTGTLTVIFSDGLRVKNSGLIVDNQGGDIIVNNISLFQAPVPFINGLVCKYISDTTIDIDIVSCVHRGFNTPLNVTLDITDGIQLNGRDDDNQAVQTSKSEHFIWLLQKDSDGALATVWAYNKTDPLITNAAFDGYSVVTMLTHFVADGTDDIIDFLKVGNDFIFRILPQVQSTSGTAYVSSDMTLFIPEIDEIQANKIRFGGEAINTSGNNIFSRFSIDGGTLEYLKVAVERVLNSKIYEQLELAYQTTYHIKGEVAGQASTILFAMGCKYNNIAGG